MQRLVAIFIFAYTLLPLGYAVGESFDHSHRAWTDLLRQHVVLIDGGSASQVRYAEFKNKRTELKVYLDTLSSVTLAEFATAKLLSRPACRTNECIRAQAAHR